MAAIGNVTGINRLRIDIDGPGVTALVGLHGCELECKYCINAKSPPPIRYTVSMLYDVVKKDRLYFDNTGGGVCFGGHEPLMQKQFIMDFIDYVRAQGDTWKIGIETSLNFPVYPQDLINKLDYIICDVKDTNTDIYKAYTGQDNYYTMANLKRLREQMIDKAFDDNKIELKLRLPLIYGYNTLADINKSKEILRDIFMFENVDIEQFEYKITKDMER